MKRKLTIEELRQIPKMLEEDKNYSEIAEALGVSVSAIYYWIRRMKNAHVKLKVTRGRRALDLTELDK